MGSTAEAVELTGDKARLAERLQPWGSTHRRPGRSTRAWACPLIRIIPAVLKPVDGAGALDTFFVSDADRLPDEARKLRTALLQPFVPGEPMSASFLLDRDARAWLIGVGRQHIEIKNARFEYHGGTIPQLSGRDVEQPRMAVESIAGLRGFVGVDFIWDPARRHDLCTGNQPATDDFLRGIEPALTTRPPGSSVARRLLANGGWSRTSH